MDDMDDDDEDEGEGEAWGGVGTYRWRWTNLLVGLLQLLHGIAEDLEIFFGGLAICAASHHNWRVGQTDFADSARSEIEAITTNAEA